MKELIAEGKVNSWGEFKHLDFRPFTSRYIRVYIETDKEKSPKIFKWKGEELPNWGDIYNAIDEINTKKEGKEFVKVADSFAKDDGVGWINSLLDYMCPDERADDIRILLGIKNKESKK